MDYDYRVVPFIGRARGDLSAANVAQQLEAVINEHAAQGWEFHQISDVNIEVQPGCLAGLFGAKVQYVRFDQLIFRNDRSAGRHATQLSTPREDRHVTRADTPPVSVLDGGRDPRLSHSDDISPAAIEHVVPTRYRLPPVQRHLEIWRAKSDDELRTAAASLDDFTDEAREVIRAELAWRKLVADGEDAKGVVEGSFCYHCGADVAAGAQTCSACGNAL